MTPDSEFSSLYGWLVLLDIKGTPSRCRSEVMWHTAVDYMCEVRCSWWLNASAAKNKASLYRSVKVSGTAREGSSQEWPHCEHTRLEPYYSPRFFSLLTLYFFAIDYTGLLIGVLTQINTSTPGERICLAKDENSQYCMCVVCVEPRKECLVN